MDVCCEKLGVTPRFWLRYLSLRDGSAPLDNSECNDLHTKYSNYIYIGLIYNPDSNMTTYEKGQTDANDAYNKAIALSPKAGIAIWRDVETSDTITSSYIRGFCDTLKSKKYNGKCFKPGFYMNPKYGSFSDAFESAFSTCSKAAELWSCQDCIDFGTNPTSIPNWDLCQNHPASLPHWSPSLYQWGENNYQYTGSGSKPAVDVDVLEDSSKLDLFW